MDCNTKKLWYANQAKNSQFPSPCPSPSAKADSTKILISSLYHPWEPRTQFQPMIPRKSTENLLRKYLFWMKRETLGKGFFYSFLLPHVITSYSSWPVETTVCTGCLGLWQPTFSHVHYARSRMEMMEENSLKPC